MILVLLADGCEEIEALTPVDLMRRAQLPVVTVSINETATVTGAHAISLTADTTIRSLIAENVLADIEMLVLPGGMPGTTNLDASPEVDILLNAARANGAYIAAICAAPMILGKRGILRGKRAVCYPSFEPFLEGAEIDKCNVVTDGEIITSRGMGTALPFALTLISLLCGDEAACAIKASILA